MNAEQATEQATIRAFVVRTRQGLYLALLTDDKGRERLTDRLLSGRDLDPAALLPIPDDERKPERVTERLRKLGAGEHCYVISADSAIDGREAELGETLKQVIGKGKPALVSCVTGRLGYFEGSVGDPVVLRTSGARNTGERR